MDGHRVLLGGRRAERLLALLLVESPRPVSIDRLVEAVWSTERPPTAAHQVRKMIATLRRLLDPAHAVLRTDGAGYRADVGPDRLDLALFEVQVAAARAACPAAPEQAIVALRSGLSLWTGFALSGTTGPLLESAARVLDDRRASAVVLLAELSLAAGRAVEVVAELQQVVTDHPLREDVLSRLILALYRSGRQADAFAAYDVGRRLLRQELGVEPGADLVALFQGMLRSDPSLRPPSDARAGPGRGSSGPRTGSADPGPPTDSGDDRLPADRPAGLGSALPYDMPDFCGRVAELSALSTIVPEASRQAVVIVSIDGMAGVGKTALAVHAAHRLADRFPDAQLFLDLLGCAPGDRPMDPLEALGRLLRAVDVPAARIPPDLEDRAALWRSEVADRSMVLLLDNAASAAQVRPLLPGRPGSVVLVTSRARLGGLDGAVPFALAPPPHAVCLAIVRSVVGAARVDAERAEVDELLRLCGHLPLAVRLAAARLRIRPLWSVAHLLCLLRDAERRVDELAVDDRSVAAAFRLTYDGLPEEHRRVFRLLGLLPVVDVTVVEAVAVSGLSRVRAAEVLEDLLDARLLEQPSTDRYQFHDLLRAYALALAGRTDPADERAAAVRRVYGGLLAVARACGSLLQPGWSGCPDELAQDAADVPTDVAQARSWLNTELENAVATARAASAAGLPEYAVALGIDLGPCLHLAGRWSTQLELLQCAVSTARRAGDRTAELPALVAQFAPLWYQGRTAEAMAGAGSAASLARALGNRRLEALCLSHIGCALQGSGHYRQSLTCYQKAIAVHRETGDRHDVLTVLLSESGVHGALGNLRAALRSAEEAVRIAGELGSADSAVTALVVLGTAQLELGLLGVAEVSLEEALRVAVELGTPCTLLVARTELAALRVRQGRHAAAREMVRLARAQAALVDVPVLHVDLANTAGHAHLGAGEIDDARRAYKAALTGARRIGDQGRILVALSGLADSAGRAGDQIAHHRLAREVAEVRAELDLRLGTTLSQFG